MDGHVIFFPSQRTGIFASKEQWHQTRTGIKFLERHPALCTHIWQYPPNQSDDVRRADLKLSLMQSLLKNCKIYGTQDRHFTYN